MTEPVLIDVRGLKCPLPVLKAARRMQAYPGGTRFSIAATDPLAAIDVPNFCRENGHTLLRTSREGEDIVFEVEKGPEAST